MLLTSRFEAVQADNKLNRATKDRDVFIGRKLANVAAQARREGDNRHETESLSRRCLKRPGQHCPPDLPYEIKNPSIGFADQHPALLAEVVQKGLLGLSCSLRAS